MSTRIVPIDQNGFPIQTLALGDSTVKLTVTSLSSRGALPSGASHEDIVRLACNTDCHIKFGDDTVEATTSDALFTQGVEAFKIPDQATHVAAVIVADGQGQGGTNGANGILTMTEMR